jgi:O-antigen/teichoic acid export membrane protein
VSVASRIGSNMAAALVGKAIVAVAGLITVAIMTRHLGADGYGVLRIAQTFVLFAGTLAHMGLHYVMVREVAVDEQHARRIIGSALSLRLIVAAVALALAVAIAVFGPWNRTVLLALIIAAVGMVAYQSNEIITGVLQWRLSQGRAMLAEVVGTLVTLAGAAFVVLAGYGVLSMTAVSSLGLVVIFLLAWYLANRLTPVGLVIDVPQWRRLAQAGLPIALSSYLSLISLRGDTLLLSLLKPAADVGLYGVATKIYEVGLQLPVIFGGLLMPVFARSAGNPKVLREQLTLGLHALIIVGGAIVLTLAFFARDIIMLLTGDGFLAATPAVQLTGISLALASYSTVLRYAAIAQQRQQKVLVADFITTLLAVCAYLILISRMSFMGAVYGKLVGEIAIIICLLSIVRKDLHGLPWSNLNLRALISGVLAAAALYLMRLGGLPTLLVAALGAVIYGALLFLTGAVSPAMLRQLLTPAAKS